MQQLNWSAPLTNKLLVEMGIGYPNSLYGEPPTPEGRALVQVNEQGGLIPGLTYRARDFSINRGGLVRWVGSMSYVTGAHNLKIGFDGERFYQVRAYSAQQDGFIQFRFNNGVPNRFTMGYNNWRYELVVPQQAVYIQDSSTFGRLTVHTGLRLDTRPQLRSRAEAVPAVVRAEGNPVSRNGDCERLPRSQPEIRRGLRSAGRRENLRQGEHGPISGGSECRRHLCVHRSRRVDWRRRRQDRADDHAVVDRSKQQFRAGLRPDEQSHQRRVRALGDPELRRGPHQRRRSHTHRQQRHVVPPALRLGASVCRCSTNCGRGSRSKPATTGGGGATDRSSTTSWSGRRTSMATASRRRWIRGCPGGGGYAIGDLQDVTNAKFGATSNYEVFTSNFGKDVRYFHAVDLNVRGQLRSVTHAAGDHHRTSGDGHVRADLRQSEPAKLSRRAAVPDEPQRPGRYNLPKVDVQISGVLRSSPGSQISANLVYTSAQVAQTLGRPLSGGTANVTINLLNPDQMYRDRINLVDLRFAKTLRFGEKRVNVGVDIFNAFNSNVVLNSNNTYGAAWLTPTSVQVARQMQLSAKFDF